MAIKKEDLTYKTDHQKFLEQQEALLIQRETELSKLESIKDKTPAIEKRIARYNEIIFNIKTGIAFVQMAEKTRRPYGL
ncbi:MAG: hypothetical protein IKZ49_04455 [Alphaproteobacteria bacterium]|nr:hypothetical protein [Alphaproteobacteria bacterium]